MSMNLKRDIKPITYLKNRTTDVVQEVSEGRTVVITQNGEAKMVIIGVEEYDRLQSALALLKIVQHSEADVKRRRTLSQEQVFERIESIIEEEKRQKVRRAD
ncbi:MAG: type II toxin-antitoxin system Phd/YefM family antitoxin [Acidobacteria bacterium]|nr:MAG: type II toxin-antitoxin system Phd/YefM family antitoxin [Acidobacteriota bacterium]